MVLLAKFNTPLYSRLNATKVNHKKKKGKMKVQLHTQQFEHICPKHPRDLLELKCCVKYILYVFIYFNIVMTSVQRESGYKS